MTRQFAPYVAQQMQDKTQVVAQLMAAQLAAATGQLGSQLTSAISAQVKGQMAGLSSALSSGFSFDSSAFARAPRLNVANIFNAETVIEGLTSGVFAVLTVYLISVPVNAVVYGW